ncbi:hypothetical protein [Lysinibacillus sp. NPDC056232]|uniref:hypothetical protein n=1 Tax=Lysinibacillus sp. NPDC056232 TaxID=3345756 RepID=UPI0035D8A4CA
MSRLGQHDVGHEGVITGCDGFSLRSSIANPRGVAQPPLQSTICQLCIFSHVILIYSNKSKLQYHFFEKVKRQQQYALSVRQQQMISWSNLKLPSC